MKWHNTSEAPRASRQDGTGTPEPPGMVLSFILIVPLNSAYEAGCVGHGPVKHEEEL
jgi:hypothetical protein